MSGLPFNPMRKTPPPPPHVDTVGLTPTDFIMVTSADGHVFLVHRDCLCGSPVLRRAFAKRYNISTTDLVISFDDAAKTLHSSMSPWDRPAPAPVRRTTTRIGDSITGNEDAPDGVPEVAFTIATDEGNTDNENVDSSAPSYRPVVVHESLRNDNTVVVVFPTFEAAVVDLLLGYLYYKHRYDGTTDVQRPPFDVPKEHAIQLAKLAQSLEC